MVKMIARKDVEDRKSLKRMKTGVKQWSAYYDNLYDALHALKEKREELDDGEFVEQYVRITDEIDVAIHNGKELKRIIKDEAGKERRYKDKQCGSF